MSKIRPKTYHFGYSVAMLDSHEKCYEWNNTSERILTEKMEHKNEYEKTSFWKLFMMNEKNTYCQQRRKKSSFSQEKIENNTCHCMNHTKTARRRRFKSQSGYYLAMLSNGKIIGTKDESNKCTEIDVIPVGSNLVKIWGVEAGLFLMIDDAGQMRGTDVDSAECIFEETLTENFFNVYYSAMYLHKRWCINLQNKQNSRTFYRKLKPSKDTSFVTEIVSRRASLSSTSNYSDDSRTCSL